MADNCSLQRGEVGGAVSGVDVVAIRIGADNDYLGSGVGENLRRYSARCTVSAVQHNLQAVKAIR